jgi:hypothetical protein
LSRAVPGRGLLRSTWTLGLFVLVVTWPVTTLAPATGLDPSWQAALHLAAHERISFGDDLIFTYGPLGFLNFPQLYYPFTAGLAMVYLIGVRLAIAVSLVWAARRSMPLPVAFAFAFLTAGILSFTEDAVVVPVFIWCVAALLGSDEDLAARALPVAGGIVAGVEILGKLNVGVTVLALLAITILALPNYKRRLLIFAATFVPTTLVGWLAAGGSLSQLWPFLLNAGSIISGYSSAMQYDDPHRQWWLPLGILSVAGLGLAGAYFSSGGVSRRRRAVLALLWMIFAFVAFKEGFVRQGPDRKAIFFGLTAGALFAFRWRPGREFAAVLSLVVAVLLYFGATDARIGDVVQPRSRADHAFDQLRTMLTPSRRRKVIDATRAQMQAAYALDPATRKLIGDASVHIYPHEATAAWAYELNWKPLPAFQTYTAYTKRLDELNVDALASRDGPEFVLRKAEPTIDSRNANFDSPAAVVAMVCHYDEVTATAAWELLRHVGNRCGSQRLITTAEASLGDSVRVPSGRRNELVLARVEGIQVSGLERLRTLLYRAYERAVVINDRVFRLLPGTATDGLLLRMPTAADWSGAYGFAASNEIGAGNADAIAFYRRNPYVEQPADRRLRISFYAMRINPSEARGRAGAER